MSGQSVCALKLKHIWGMLQNNDSKHTNECFKTKKKEKKMKVLERPSQSLNMNYIELLLHDLKPPSVAERKQF